MVKLKLTPVPEIPGPRNGHGKTKSNEHYRILMDLAKIKVRKSYKVTQGRKSGPEGKYLSSLAGNLSYSAKQLKIKGLTFCKRTNGDIIEIYAQTPGNGNLT